MPPSASVSAAVTPSSSSFSSILSPIISPPSFPSLPTSLLSSRRSSRRRTFISQSQQQPPSFAASTSIPQTPRSAASIRQSQAAADETLGALSVKGAPAPKVTGSMGREMAGWLQQQQLRYLQLQQQQQQQQAAQREETAAAQQAGALRLQDWKEADDSTLSERKGRRASWRLIETSSSAAASAAKSPSSSAPFAQTYSSASEPSAITVALSTFSGAEGGTLTFSAQQRPQTSAHSTRPLRSVGGHGLTAVERSDLASASHAVPSSPLRRRSSLPSVWSSSSPATAGSPSASSSPSSFLLARLRQMGSSAWSRSTVDRFGRRQSAAATSNQRGSQDEGDANAWGFEDEEANRQQKPPSLPVSPPASPPARSAASPSSFSSAARQWNFGTALPDAIGQQRSLQTEEEEEDTAAKANRRREAVPRFERRTSSGGGRRRRSRRSRQRAEEAEEPQGRWGHWNNAGRKDGEEPRFPFPHRTFLFKECTKDRRHCTDRWCAKHGEPGADDSEDEEERQRAAASAQQRAAEEEQAARQGGLRQAEEEKESLDADEEAAQRSNMHVVSLRGAGNAALLAAFSRATPAYAALSRRTPSVEAVLSNVTLDTELLL